MKALKCKRKLLIFFKYSIILKYLIGTYLKILKFMKHFKFN